MPACCRVRAATIGAIIEIEQIVQQRRSVPRIQIPGQCGIEESRGEI